MTGERIARFERLLDDMMHGDRAGAAAGPGHSLQARVEDFSAKLDRAIAARRIGRSTVPAPAAAPRESQRDPRSGGGLSLTGLPALRALDDMFAQRFALAGRGGAMAVAMLPTVYADSLEDFFEPCLADIDTSPSLRQRELERLVAQAEEQARDHGAGTLGVHLPGRGCYVNGWLFATRGARMTGTAMTPREALVHPELAPRILATVVHEKLGHGFIAEATALGAERKQRGLSRWVLARRHDLRVADGPDSALLGEKERLLYHGSLLLEEGWATWIEHHLTDEHDGAGGSIASAYSLEVVWEHLEALAKSGTPEETGTVRAVQKSLSTLLMTDDLRPRAAHLAMLTLWQGVMALDCAPALELAQPLRYVLGYILFRCLEERVGATNLPYVAAIAANVRMDAGRFSAPELRLALERDARLYPDGRRVQFLSLGRQACWSPEALAGAARGALDLAPPIWLSPADA